MGEGESLLVWMVLVRRNTRGHHLLSRSVCNTSQTALDPITAQVSHVLIDFCCIELNKERSCLRKRTPPPGPSDAPSQIRTRPRGVKLAIREILRPYVHFGAMTVGVDIQRYVIEADYEASEGEMWVQRRVLYASRIILAE